MSKHKNKDLRFLGQAENSLPAEPSREILDCFPNKNKHRRFVIKLAMPDFTSMCPVTGQPDFGHLRIVYCPRDFCVETKSLKFYLHSYRNFAAFNEDLINRILDDLCVAIKPRFMRVNCTFASRGGIILNVKAKHVENSKN